MALRELNVIHAHTDPMDNVLIHGFDDRQIVLVFISRTAVDDYFRKSKLTPQQRNLLIDRNLANLAPVIAGKYERGEISSYTGGTSGISFPRVDLTLADLQQAQEKLTDTVLDIAAGAGFQRC